MLEYKYTELPKDKKELRSLSDKKHIYVLKNNPKIFVKVIPKEEKNKMQGLQEVSLQKEAHLLGLPTPKIYDFYWHQGDLFIVMERIQGNCLNAIYGGNPRNIPRFYWKQIREIIENLYLNGIEYVDITSMNFMKGIDGKIYIVDFGHAYYSEDDDSVDYFLDQFLDGLNEWNPYYL